VIAVYGKNGGLVRTLGRLGGGPEEFSFPGLYIVPGVADTLLIVQERQLKVYSPDLRYVRSIPLPGGAFGNPIALPDGRILFPSSIPTSELAGKPLHLLTPAGERLGSFGGDELNPRCPSCMIRYLARAARTGTIWSLRQDEYRLEEWSPNGTALRTIAVSGSSWFPDWVSEQLRSGQGRIGPATPAFVGFWVEDATGYVWAVGLAPRDGRIELKAGTRRGVIAGQPSNSEAQAVRTTIVDVIDPSRRIVLASYRFDGRIMGVASPGVLYSRREDKDGYVSIDLWAAHLSQPSPQR
jgi:hypothetical protein